MYVHFPEIYSTYLEPQKSGILELKMCPINHKTSKGS